uniref:Uncharacterized protein n=1 Tax=Corethron hystrix TaxID=216773 RepID=A0A6U5HC02_9STRA|mmetsp:Transcript_29901/g.68612  ORF Transcript_29901/g.68612 Transcript_29901/m.68612 type:complete len:170 (+) Transcript_29901:235-744(+)
MWAADLSKSQLNASKFQTNPLSDTEYRLKSARSYTRESGTNSSKEHTDCNDSNKKYANLKEYFTKARAPGIRTTPSDDTEITDNKSQQSNSSRKPNSLTDIFFWQNKQNRPTKIELEPIRSEIQMENTALGLPNDATRNTLLQNHSNSKCRISNNNNNSWPPPLTLPYL